MNNKTASQYLKNRTDIKEIEHAIISGQSMRDISKKYDCSVSSLSRYKNSYLAQKCNTIQAKKDLREGEELLNLLERYIEQVNMISDACIDVLRDPDNPEKLFIGPTADEITLTWYEYDEEKDVDRKCRGTMQQCLDRLNEKPTRIEINTPDRVDSLLKASHAMNKHLSLFADIKGMLGNVTINLTNQPVFIQLTQSVLLALEPWPEARQQVAQSLLESMSDHSIGQVIE